MADNIAQTTVISQGGLDSTENHLLLDAQMPGSASRLVNFEVGQYGGYRRIEGYEYLDSSYPVVDDTNAEGKILGLVIYRSFDGVETIMAARKQKSGATYNWYYYTEFVGWTPFSIPFTLDLNSPNGSVVKIRTSQVTFGGTAYLIAVDGANSATVFDGTDWYQIGAGTYAGTELDPGGDQALEAPSYVSVFQNHVFLSGDGLAHSIVCHSAPENPLDWNVRSGAGQLPSGLLVKNIFPFRDTLYVFGNPGLKKINVDSSTFVINDVATNVGLVSSDSLIEINGDVLFLSQDGIRTVSGTAKIGDINLASLSRQILRTTDRIQKTYDMNLLISVVIKKKSQFRFFISQDNETSTGTGIIGGIRATPNGDVWEFSELSGIRASVVTSGYIGNYEYILHGDYDGSIYRQEQGSTFNGSPVLAIYSTPFLTFGDPIRRKLARKLHTFIRTEGSLDINLSLEFDWKNPDVKAPAAFGDSATVTLYRYDDGTLYDSSAVYDSAAEYPIIDTDIEGSFKSIRLTYTTTVDTVPYTINGFILEYSVQGNR